MLRPLLFAALFLGALGCQPPSDEHLRQYNWAGGDDAVRQLCQRSGRVQTVSSEAALTLTRSDGQSVRLDAAMVMRLPDSVRIRAWKFNQPVFDLTLTPAGAWMESGGDPSRQDELMPAGASAAKMAGAWALVSSAFFCEPGGQIVDAGGPRFSFVRSRDGQRIVCEVERATLTPRLYHVYDSAGAERFSLAIDRYQMIGDVPWPVRLTGKSEGGVIAIELSNPELNGELAPNAFVPPRKAKKLP